MSNERDSQEEIQLYQRVDEVIHYIWDPIGVSGVPQARDEYYSYLPKVFELLKENNDREKIADHLGRITLERMGLDKNRMHDLDVADILISWKTELLGILMSN